MSFSNGQTGIERSGGGKLLFGVEPKLLSRFVEGGTDRALAISVPGTPIVCEYEPEDARRKVVLRVEALTEAQMDTLLALLDDPGPVELKWIATGTTSYTAVFSERGEQTLEPIFGYYPEAAPARLTYWRVVLTLYLM